MRFEQPFRLRVLGGGRNRGCRIVASLQEATCSTPRLLPVEAFGLKILRSRSSTCIAGARSRSAPNLGIGEATAYNHGRKLMKIHGVRSRAALVAKLRAEAMGEASGSAA